MSELRPINGIPDAYINKDGRVWRKGREKQPSIAVVGYKVFSFSIGNKTHTRYQHRLLMETFVSPCPVGCEVLHINGNRLDNRLENLRWGTRKENMADAVRHGTTTAGIKNARAKLTQHFLGWLSDMRSMGFKPKEVAHHFGVSRTTIDNLFNGKTYIKDFK